MSELSPTQYFDLVKDKKNKINDEELERIYTNCLILLEKYIKTGQAAAAKKLMFHLETIEKERELVKMGIDTFVYRDDIEEFIQSVSKDVVKITNLEKYEREIPDEVVETLEKVKSLFDKCYIVFTDYTGKFEKQVQKERRDKDPILFGTFQDLDSGAVVDRFYFIADWEDAYCDLTLDKMVNVMRKDRNKTIAMNISTPANLDELKAQLNKLEATSIPQMAGRTDIEGLDIHYKISEDKPKSFFSKVKTFLSRKSS